MDNGLRAAPIFLYRFWLNGVGAADLLTVLDASPALASSLPTIASSPLPSIFCCLLGADVLAPRSPERSRAQGHPPPLTGRRRRGLGARDGELEKVGKEHGLPAWSNGAPPRVRLERRRRVPLVPPTCLAPNPIAIRPKNWT